ncbi:hypothetical protein GLE_0228 [Lysobacter enzymogenes]|uniref:Uncharacterized protein n=1 Tax=Lysobacter enzymogenes TaxID=69 RepID=A0A0S2DAP7_LYSEN|nr:hypothetical protein GLE_0228 [Lysobacter enzymogenes]
MRMPCAARILRRAPIGAAACAGRHAHRPVQQLQLGLCRPRCGAAEKPSKCRICPARSGCTVREGRLDFTLFSRRNGTSITRGMRTWQTKNPAAIRR